MRRTGPFKLALSVVAGVFLPAQLAANPLTLNDSEDWQYSASAALFGALRTKGTATVDGNSADYDLNLSDALKHLDFTATGRVEAWHGDFGFIAEGHYIGLSESATATSGILAGRSVEVTSTQSWLGLLAAYRVANGTFQNGRAYAADIQGGARYNRLTQTVVGSGGALDVGGTERWWEPVVGARYAWEFNEAWSGSFVVDASGFGVGGNDLAWSATLGLSKKFNDRSALVFGWRHYDLDYATTQTGGQFASDVWSSGPFVGYNYTFK